MTTADARDDGQLDLDQVNRLIAGEVRAELARQMVSDEAIASFLGENQQWFNRRKNAHVAFSGAELAAVASFLGVDVSQFFGRVVVNAPDPEPVGPAGLEPATYGLKVRSSAN